MLHVSILFYTLLAGDSLKRGNMFAGFHPKQVFPGVRIPSKQKPTSEEFPFCRLLDKHFQGQTCDRLTLPIENMLHVLLSLLLGS